jgi:hypothetical protein
MSCWAGRKKAKKKEEGEVAVIVWLTMTQKRYEIRVKSYRYSIRTRPEVRVMEEDRKGNSKREMRAVALRPFT